MQRLGAYLKELDRQVNELEQQIQAWHRAQGASQQLAEIPGIGPLTASALVASIGDARSFENGRQLAAWLGLVPRQHSSGGQSKLLGISIPIPHYPFFHTVLCAGHDYLAPSSTLSATG